MPKLIVLYPPPADTAIFERRYRLEHAPMVLEKIPGLKKFVASLVLGHRPARLRFNASRSCISIRSRRSKRQWRQEEGKQLWPMPWKSPLVDRLWS
jgi:hypothetical protein